jgi:hypothetical protein
MVRKYPCRARNTFPGKIKKKSFLENAQNFTLPAMVFFQDQAGKIPRKSWKPVSIFYSGVWHLSIIGNGSVQHIPM